MQSFIEASHLTHSEFFRLNGALSTERTEQALDSLVSMEAMQDAADYTTDAHSGYVGEDFLCEQLKDLTSLAKHMRGDNRHMLLDLIEQIKEQIAVEVKNGEYGAECLGKIVTALRQ